MGRDIKFRAWHNLNKVMYSSECVALVPNNSKSEDALFKYMQFTGQKDKNKKEIYEGDICTYKNKDGIHKGIVKFLNNINAFRVVFVDREEFYFISNENEVIGNIYENKELLND